MSDAPRGSRDAEDALRARLAHFALPPEPLDGAGNLSIATLLEEGSAAELAWLAGRLGEAALAGWLAERGGRQLSRRSRAFWELVLGRTAGEPVPLAAELWPL